MCAEKSAVASTQITSGQRAKGLCGVKIKVRGRGGGWQRAPGLHRRKAEHGPCLCVTCGGQMSGPQGGGGWHWAVALGIQGKAHRARNKTQESRLPGCLPFPQRVQGREPGPVALGGCGLEKPPGDRKAPVLSEVVLLTP